MAIRVSLSPQLLRSWAWAGTGPVPRIPQRAPSWTSRPVSQSSRPGSGGEGRFMRGLQDHPAKTKEAKTTGAARRGRSKSTVKVYRVLQLAVSGQQNAPTGQKATPEPNPVDSPSWSRFDVARDPNRTPLPRPQEAPRGPEQARGSADRHSGAVRDPGGKPRPGGDKFRGKAGVAPPRNRHETEDGAAGPFSSGIPARAPFRPLGAQTGDAPPEPQDDSTPVPSGHSRLPPAPTPTAKTVRPDVLHYEPTEYKDPVTSKYLVAKERFRPSARKDWSTPQTLSRDNWLPRNTLNPRLVEGSGGAPSTSADDKNAMYKMNLPDPDAVTGSPARAESGTRRDRRPREGQAPDDEAESANPPQDEERARTPLPPPRTPPNRAAQDAKRRLELIERQRQHLRRKHGVDADMPGPGRGEEEEEVQEALEQFVRQYDDKARRREGRRKGKRTPKGKARASVARKAAASRREEARQQALRLAGAILGPASRSP